MVLIIAAGLGWSNAAQNHGICFVTVTEERFWASTVLLLDWAAGWRSMLQSLYDAHALLLGDHCSGSCTSIIVHWGSSAVTSCLLHSNLSMVLTPFSSPVIGFCNQGDTYATLASDQHCTLFVDVCFMQQATACCWGTVSLKHAETSLEVPPYIKVESKPTPTIRP